MKRLFILITFSCLLFLQGSFAQVDLQAPLPQDPNIVTGKLPNGIVYYLRHNEEPKGRASFYIIRNAGALLENDEQDGLAHFLEHMAFQGTKNFPGKGIITSLEKHGVSFGRNINAYTAQNETVYNLSDVPTNSESLLDTCLLILHDWSYYLTLEDDEIDAERGVITEEWRTRRTPQFRIQKQMFPVLFKDSKYAIRDVIGNLDVIKNFKYQTIRDFYHEWYRTDLEAIAIVGDFDVAKMEQKVKELFSKIPAVENPTPRPFYEIPEHDEMYYCLATDKEVQQSSIQIVTLLPGTPATEKNKLAYFKDNIINSFYNQMAGARISEMMQKGNPPFINGGFGFGGFVRGYNAYSIKSPACDNSNIKNVVIEDGITSIGSSAFYSCYSLTDITIPNGVTSIEDSTFRYCSNLTSITIPDSVTSIGSSVFDDCFFLKTISLRCGSTLKRSDFDDKANFVSYTPHTLTKTAAKTETCTEDGNIEHWTCKHCGKYFLSDDTNPELQHQWNSQKPSSLQVTS